MATQKTAKKKKQYRKRDEISHTLDFSLAS